MYKRIKKIRGKVDKNVATGDEVSVYVSPIMFIMAVFFVAFGMAYEFTCSLTAVILHELAHAKAAKKTGYALNRIKIMPYGAALCGKADIKPKHEALIAAAGPAFNLVLGLIFAAMWWLIPSSYLFTSVFCRCNLYIGLFNLLPVYPLDGGRVMLAALSAKFGRKRAYKATRIISAVTGLVFVGLFVLSFVYAPNICFLSVGLFMLVSAFVPDSRAEYYALFAFAQRRARLDKPTEIKTYAVSRSAALSDTCKALEPDRLCEFAVYDERMNRCGFLSEREIIDGIAELGYERTVGDLCDKRSLNSEKT